MYRNCRSQIHWFKKSNFFGKIEYKKSGLEELILYVYKDFVILKES